MTEYITGIRLPKWLLDDKWAATTSAPALARLQIEKGIIVRIEPDDRSIEGRWHYSGNLALPSLVEAHCHLDKAFSRPRLGSLSPGLLAAIEATSKDRNNWNARDLRERAEKALHQAYSAGVRNLRTHVDWWSHEAPTAWHVFAELAEEWQDKIHIERVALIPLPLFETRAHAIRMVDQISRSKNALLGGFIHSSNFSSNAIDQLIAVACEASTPLDLHVDEELNPDAHGVEYLVSILGKYQEVPHLSIGHACALSSMSEAKALSLLDAVAKCNVTLMTLPTSNLLLQDAVTHRTPRARGITLIKEARERGIPVLIASDNVQDAFYPYGHQDPLEAFKLMAPVAQLEQPFDTDSQCICRKEWLHDANPALPTLIGEKAELLIFETTEPLTWPSSLDRKQVRFDSTN